MLRPRLFAAAFCIAGLLCAEKPTEGDVFLLRGGTVHTISGPVVENGSVLVRGGRILGVGRDLPAPEGATIIDVRGQHIYPGMIDSVGMPEPGKDAGERALPAARANGVTSIMQLPREDPLAGQISLIRTAGALTGMPDAAIYLHFPVIATNPVPPHEPAGDDDEPATARPPEPVPFSVAKRARDAKLKALNRFFDDARRYRRNKLSGARQRTDPRLEAMLPLLDGSTPLLVTAVREREIREAIAFADRQRIRIVLADAYECYKVLPLIRARDIPVVLGPPLSLPLEEDDPYDRSYTTAAALSRAGIRFSIGTFSYRMSRNLPYQAAAAVAFGLPHDEAYRAVSLSAAEIFGMGKRLGSIDEGKIADLIVADGDPLEATTHVTQVFIEGKPVSLETRQKRLYETYRSAP